MRARFAQSIKAPCALISAAHPMLIFFCGSGTLYNIHERHVESLAFKTRLRLDCVNLDFILERGCRVPRKKEASSPNSDHKLGLVVNTEEATQTTPIGMMSLQVLVASRPSMDFRKLTAHSTAVPGSLQEGVSRIRPCVLSPLEAVEDKAMAVRLVDTSL